MGRIQQKTGLNFQQHWLEILHQRGLFAYQLGSINGTAFDIISVINGVAVGYECKNISKGAIFRTNAQIEKKFDELDNATLYMPILLCMRFEERKRIYVMEWYNAKMRLINDGKILMNDCILECVYE